VRTAAAACVIAFVVATVPQAATAAPLTVTCNGGVCDTSGWYKTNITVAFAWDPNGVTSTRGCDTVTITSDTGGRAFDCVVTYGGTPPTNVEAAFTIKRDASPPNITGASLSRGPDSNGWYNHAVGVTFNGSDATSGLAGCTATTYAGPDTGGATVNGTCTDQAGNVSGVASSPTIKYDVTPPTVSASFARGADSNGWYNHAVSFGGSGSDGLSGMSGCSSGTYSGPDTGSASVSVSCTDQAGNTGSASLPLKYDATAPSIDPPTFDRPPDANGWYNHPVRITFSGNDNASGVSCSSTTYSGPDRPDAAVTGTCVDGAGNSSPAAGSPAFKYDSTPPKLLSVEVKTNDKFVSLTWTASSDTASVQVARTPGMAGPDPSTVYTGLASSYEDRNVQNKVKYTYTITGTDQAGNTVVDTVTVIPAAALYSPAPGAVVHRPPTLAWRPVRQATYYNLQLFRKGRKVLSAWPVKPRYRLSRVWAFHGRKFKLVRGTYEWRVWPGLGKRAAHKYGALLGHSTFVVG
jgi:hypothetical protein